MFVTLVNDFHLAAKSIVSEYNPNKNVIAPSQAQPPARSAEGGMGEHHFQSILLTTTTTTATTTLLLLL